MRISTAEARGIWGPAAGAASDCALVVVPRAFSQMVMTFRGSQRKPRVLVVQSRLFVTGERRGALIS